jgi:endonuclease YncB( thermonuclease family)
MRWAPIAASLLWLVLAFAEPSSEALVVGAETIDVDGTHFRLHGIDAPEPDQTCRADGYDLSEGMVYTSWVRADWAVSRRDVELENGTPRAAGCGGPSS